MYTLALGGRFPRRNLQSERERITGESVPRMVIRVNPRVDLKRER